MTGGTLRWPFAAVALAGLLASPVPVTAAEQGPEEPAVPSELLVSDWRLGPFYVKPTFGIENVGWDDNVFLAPPGFEQKDFTATIVPAVQLGLPFGDNAFLLRERLAYVWFQEFESERGLDSATELELELLLGSVQLSLQEAFRSTRERYEAEIYTRARRLENEFRARLDTARDAGVYFEGDFGFNLLRFDEDETFAGSDLSEELDRNELRVGLAAVLDFGGPARLLLGGTLEQNRFEYEPELKDADGWFAYSGLRFEPGETITGDLRIGYRHLGVDRADHPDYGELAFRADLDFEFSEAAHLRLEASREPYFSIFGDNVYYAATRVRGTLHVPLGDRFALEGGPLWLATRYPVAEPTILGDEVKRADDVFWWEATGVIKFAESLGLRLGVAGRKLTSNFPGAGYDDFVIVAGIRYE